MIFLSLSPNYAGVNIAETLAAAEAAAQIAAAAGGANTPEGKSALSRLFNFTQNLSLPPNNSGIDIFSGKSSFRERREESRGYTHTAQFFVARNDNQPVVGSSVGPSVHS